MRIAIVSDIHGNLTAFNAVLADLRETSPDLIVHGGDLADSGSAPAEIVDRVRDLNWPGVLGNTDEMLFRPESLSDFATRLPHLKSMFDAIEEIAAFTREALGSDRLAWLEQLPRAHVQEAFALVHAAPDSCWRTSADEDLLALGKPLAVYGHIHKPFIRKIEGATICNSGSVSLSYDGDPRASYLLIDNGAPQIRRVVYDVESEIRAISANEIPHADWIAGILRTASPQPLGFDATPARKRSG